MLAAAERRPRDPQGEEGNVAKEFMNFFLFLCRLLCGALIRCPFFVCHIAAPRFLAPLQSSKSSYQKTLSNYLVRTSEEESGYKKCCTRFVLEPRIGRSSSARTSAAAAAEGEQHRVQQQRAAAARFG